MDFQRLMHSPTHNHMQSMQLLHYLADLHSLLKQAHHRVPLLLNSLRYPQLAVLLQSLQNRLNDYYKFTPAMSKDFQAIRTLNKLRKRQEITILHNQAILSMKQNQIESAIDIRTVIVEELKNMIQGEQTRYGFLEEDDQKQRKSAMESIAYWKRELVKHYYFFAKLTYLHSSLEIALAAIMKGLDLIKQSYQNQLKTVKDSLNLKEKGKRTHDESYSEKLCHFEQVQELFLLWQLRQKVSHSKYLNIVSSNALTEIICTLCKEGNHKETYSSEFQTFEIDKINELELPKIEDIISHAYTGKIETNQFQVNKVAHFLYLGLLSKIYSDQNNQTQNEYQKLKNAKNVVFLHMIHAAIAHYYLKKFQNTQEILQEYRNIYKSKLISPKKTANIYTLIQIFGLTPQSLAQHDQTQQEVSIIQMNKKIMKNTKKHISTQKRRLKSQQKSKSKSKSKSKGRPVPSKAIKRQNQQKQKKKRVRQEYMMKRDVKNHTKVGENHLIKAINQNYRSFDSSLSKEKHQSPFRRAIRTETCINNKKIKQQGPSIKTQQVHRQKKPI